ncbi:MAG TPA: SdrD B-like domain-containing protein, partial [Ferruginibacter sp.]|nr:SdrD B-like domain-containing protein [Ferruginibacter sp.]
MINKCTTLLLLLLVFSWSNKLSAQVVLSLNVQEKNNQTSLLAGNQETLQLYYAVSSTTGNAQGVKVTVSLPDNIYDVSNFVGSTHAPASNFVFSNITGNKKLTISFINPVASGSNGVLEFNLRTNNLLTPNNTLISTQSVMTANGGYSSAIQTQSVTVMASPAICAIKSLISGGGIGYPFTYRILVNPGYNNYYMLSPGSLMSTNVRIIDTLPDGASFIRAKIYNAWSGAYVTDATEAMGVVTATLPDLGLIHYAEGRGQAYYVEIEVQYNNPSFSPGNVVTNKAIVYYTPLGGTEQILRDGDNIRGACTADLKEITMLQAANVNALLQKTPLYGSASSVYPGNSFAYNILFQNTGNVPLDSVEIIESIPAGLRIDYNAQYNGIRLDAWGTYIHHGEYQTNLSSGWVVLPASATKNFPATLPTGEYYTKLKLVLKSPFASNSSLTGYNLLFFVPATEVSSTQNITNCLEWNSTTAGIPAIRTACNSYFNLVPRPDSAKLVYTATHSPACSAPISIGQTVTFQGKLEADPGYSAATDPVVSLLVPVGFEFIPGSELFTVSNSGIVVQPTFQMVRSFLSIGGLTRDLYRFVFPAGTVLPAGKNFSVQVSCKATNTLIPGVAYTTDFVGDARNASIRKSNYSYGLFTDSNDWDLDGKTTETFERSNSDYICCSLVINSNASMESVKWVKGLLDSNYSKYPQVANTVPGSKADYQMIVRNTGNVTIKNIRLIDILPAEGDSGVIDLSPRASAWRPNLAGPIDAPAGITVYYSSEPNPCRDEIKPPTAASPFPAGCAVANWTSLVPEDLTQVRAIKIDFGARQLTGGDSILFTWPMRAPINTDTSKVAWNSFAFTARRADNDAVLIAAEPNKVGIQVHKGKPGIFGDRVWYDTDQDGIQDEGEGGVDGIIVKLFSPTVPGIRNPATDAMITFTITGNGGYYLFSNLPEGDYYAVYLLPNSPVLSVLHAPGSTSETDSDGEATNVNGVDAAITAITHILSTETDLSWDLGVYCPSFAPAVSMPQTVWSGTNITLSASGGSSYTWSGPGGFTATGSTINIPSVAAADTGLYQVTIIQSGCFATLNTSLSIFAGSSIGNYVWNDANGNGVQDLGEAGMSGVTAKLYTSTDSLVMTKQSDNNGAYSFENINPGIYYLHFQAPSGYAFTASLNAGDNQDDTNSDANPMSGQTLPFTLSAGEFDRTKDAGLISSIVTPVTLLSFT